MVQPCCKIISGFLIKVSVCSAHNPILRLEHLSQRNENRCSHKNPYIKYPSIGPLFVMVGQCLVYSYNGTLFSKEKE